MFASLDDSFKSIDFSPDSASEEDFRDACDLIISVQSFSDFFVKGVEYLFKNGPTMGDNLNIQKCKELLTDRGYFAHIVIEGKHNFYALTYRGKLAYNLLKTSGRIK